MVELNIDKESLYGSENIQSNIKCKALLDYHSEAYNEYKGHLENTVKEIIAKSKDLNNIKNKINSNDLFLLQLEEIEQERQTLYKKRNDYLQSKKFTNPTQEALTEDAIIRQSLNKDENYNHIGSMTNLVFNIASIKQNPRYAEAILRQTSVSINYINLTEDQTNTLKDMAYGNVDPDYESKLDDLDTIEEELSLNRQYIDNHLSGLLEGLL